MPIEPLADLVLQAKRAPLSQQGIASLANAAPLEVLSAALTQTIETSQVDAATNLALAIGVGGGRIAPELALRLIPDLDGVFLMPVIAGIIEGDRVTALLDLVDRQTLSWEREALALYLVTHLTSKETRPPRLVSRLRMLAREPVSDQAGLLIGLAANVLELPELDAVAADLRALASSVDATPFLDAIVSPLFRPVLESLPERESPRSHARYTVVRRTAKVGRNDPCPCGSGRKYKKCCATKDEELAAPQTAVERFASIGAGKARLRDRILEDMRPGEMAQLDPSTLTTPELLTCIRHLTLHRRFPAAETFFEVFSMRPDVPTEHADAHRADLIDEAFEAGELDVAERQIALATTFSEQQLAEYRVRLALARRSPDAWDALEETLRGALDTNPTMVIDCVLGLLQHSPALGILAARGCIDANRLLDAEMLLDRIELARDRIGLDPEEPWWDLFDLLVDNELAADETQQRERELETMRADLAASKRRERLLDAEVNQRMAQLESLSRERETLTAMVHAARKDVAPQRVSELERESQRLRGKIAELKGEISEGAAQRSELRRQLAQAAETRRETNAARELGEGELEADEHDDAEEQESVPRPRRVLTPRFAPAASRALSQLPSRVAADALQETAHLAGIDAHAWSRVKRMRAAREVLSARIGRAHRLLFQHDGEFFEVLEIIHRRDLDAVVHRLAERR